MTSDLWGEKKAQHGLDRDALVEGTRIARQEPRRETYISNSGNDEKTE